MITVITSIKGIVDILLLILIFVFVLVLSYFAAKLAGKYQNNVLNKKSNIKIIEFFRLGNNKLIAIAKIGEDYYALGIGKDEITFIDKISPDKLTYNAEEKLNDNKQTFKDILTQLKNKNDKTK